MRLILASASPRRAELLRQLGVTFEIIAADVDERIDGNPPPRQYVMELARRKAVAVSDAVGAGRCAESNAAPGSSASCSSAALGRGLVIGADTVVVAPGGAILGKPSDAEDARRMLGLLGGAWHEVYTGVCVIAGGSDSADSGSDSSGSGSDSSSGSAGVLLRSERTRVKMRPLGEHTVARYVATGEPDDKAGAYAIQGLGSLLVERIEGCHYNVMGLPLALLGEMLAECGLALL